MKREPAPTYDILNKDFEYAWSKDEVLQVGDHVRVIGEGYPPYVREGRITEILAQSQRAMVRLDQDRGFAMAYLTDLKKIEP
jgi:hypothetical protein